MPKASKVGKARAAAKASSRDVRAAPLTAEYLTQKKSAATNDDVDATLAELGEKETQSLSRGQKKRLAKREKYLKRDNMVMSSLRLQRLEEQKGRLDGLDAIREALGNAISPSSKSSTAAAKDLSKSAETATLLACNTNKSKKTLANTEISHMGLVLQHPSFKENPFAAIQQHLRNSLAPEAEKMKKESLQRDEKDNVEKAKKKEERKEHIRDAKFNKHRKRRGFKTNRAGRIG